MNLTIKDAARLLNVSEKTIRQWVKERGLPAYHINEQLRFHRSELLEWATEQRVQICPSIFSDQEHGGVSLPSVSDALTAGGILYGVPGNDKTSVLRAVVDALALPDEIDRDFLFHVLLAREALGSTGIGDGIAIPHVRNPIVLHVSQPTITLCFLEHPINFDAIDSELVHTLFTLVSPTVQAHHHLLSRLGYVLKDPGFRASLMRRDSPAELMESLKRAEASLRASDLPAPAGLLHTGSIRRSK